MLDLALECPAFVCDFDHDMMRIFERTDLNGIFGLGELHRIEYIPKREVEQVNVTAYFGQ